MFSIAPLPHCPIASLCGCTPAATTSSPSTTSPPPASMLTIAFRRRMTVRVMRRLAALMVVRVLLRVMRTVRMWMTRLTRLRWPMTLGFLPAGHSLRFVAEDLHPRQGIIERRPVQDASRHTRRQLRLDEPRRDDDHLSQPLDVALGDRQHAETHALAPRILMGV